MTHSFMVASDRVHREIRVEVLDRFVALPAEYLQFVLKATLCLILIRYHICLSTPAVDLSA